MKQNYDQSSLTNGDQLEIILLALLFLGSYLMGSVSTAYVVVKWFKKQDIRRMGSNNVGALNAMHQIGIPWGIAVLSVDTAKGALSVLVPHWLGLAEWTTYLTTILVVAGHNWPVFLRLQGGKGVATLLGISLAIIPQITLVSLIPTLAIVALTRNVVIGVGGGLIVINALAIAATQSISQTALCLFLSVLVTATYVVGAREQIAEAVRTGQLRGLFYGTNFNP